MDDRVWFLAALGVIAIWAGLILCIVRFMSNAKGGKRCEECGGEYLSRLPSQNALKCFDCGHETPWHKDEGQDDYY